eukprot:8636063-Alexandrium_andersonii.AAC.1
MSASLVGSEMCIRDSLRGPLGAVSVAPSAWAGARGQQRHGCGAGRPSSCLLYTSDAADDM